MDYTIERVKAYCKCGFTCFTAGIYKTSSESNRLNELYECNGWDYIEIVDRSTNRSLTEDQANGLIGKKISELNNLGYSYTKDSKFHWPKISKSGEIVALVS